jgi:TRAP-type mannitol/chloroaromatic compound transport system substrate-binding protein
MTMIRKITMLSAAAAVTIGLALSGNAFAAETNWKMATSWGGGPLMEIGAKAFADKVKFLTDI